MGEGITLSFNAIGCKTVPEQIIGIPKNSRFITLENTLTVTAPDGTEFKRVEVAPDIDHRGTAVWIPTEGEIIQDIVISVSFPSSDSILP